MIFGKAGDKWKIERVKRSNYRSKAPGKDAVSAHGFSYHDMRAALVGSVDCELRGSVVLTAPYRPGDVARSLLGTWKA